MATSGFSVASIVERIMDYNTNSNADKNDIKMKIPIPLISFWKAALSSTIGSPIGYAALNYISFPLVILAKSSKPVPIIFVGIVIFGKKYTWYKLAAVVLLCGGIALFSSAKGGSIKSPHAESGSDDSHNLLIGILLVSLNLLLDGYTSNEQDRIFEKLGATPLDMMKYVNLWTIFYISIFLSIGWVVYTDQSELVKAYYCFTNSIELRYDIFFFCTCAAIGQVLIFSVMKEFGSLTWITISITRKLFTILVSVIMFNHPVKIIQWVGIALVFISMILEVSMGYMYKEEGIIRIDDDIQDKKIK